MGVCKFVCFFESLTEFTFANFLSIVAIIISSFVYFQNKRNHKQNILVNKIERIISIIESHATVYANFLNLTHDLDLYYSAVNKEDRDRNLSIYNEKRTELLKYIDVKHINDERKELEVLVRAYLNKDIQLKILSFNRMYRDLIDYTINMQSMNVKMFWNDGFPDIDKLNNYVDKLWDILIKKIGFQGEVKEYREKLREYSDKEFKKDVGLTKNE